ncbi:acyl carrier protein [Streptosporangium roseum]|uniref:acyl carrier protein n=1 Tax=Streptosporangium roseum TaxID=2001 RepID=UPI003331F56F
MASLSGPSGVPEAPVARPRADGVPVEEPAGRELSPREAGRRVEEIWRNALGLSGDRADATFGELGGRAIAAVRIVARIEDDLGIRVRPSDLYGHPRLDSFTRHVVEAGQAVRPWPHGSSTISAWLSPTC